MAPRGIAKLLAQRPIVDFHCTVRVGVGPGRQDTSGPFHCGFGQGFRRDEKVYYIYGTD